MIHNVTSEGDFQAVLYNHRLVVVDFHASWCGPCKKIAPEVEKTAEIYLTTKFVKVDIDDLEDLAARFQIRAVPTFVIIKDSKEIKRVTGGNAKVIEDVQSVFNDEMSI